MIYFDPLPLAIKIRNVNNGKLLKNTEQQLGLYRFHALSRQAINGGFTQRTVCVQENNFNLSKPPSSTLGGGSDFTTSNVLDSKRRVRACTGRIILNVSKASSRARSAASRISSLSTYLPEQGRSARAFRDASARSYPYAPRRNANPVK